MTYDEALTTFLGSAASDWHHIDSGSATFLYAAIDDEGGQDSHHDRIVYNPDVPLGLA